jgi:hypothetical protein
MRRAPKSMNLRLPYLSSKNATNGREPSEVTPKEPIIKPMLASLPSSSLINKGRRKKEEKLQKKKEISDYHKREIFALTFA